VIPLHQIDPSASVQRALNDLQAQHGTERFRGFIFLLEAVDGEQIVGASGIFASDLERAAQAAKAGFNCLLGHARCIEEDAPRSQLPRRLRKEVSNESEHHCAVVACNMRQ